MQSLATLIEMLTKGRNLHISILDLCGILHTQNTKLPYSNIIHSKQFCNIAKSTEKGYRMCMRCKVLANSKAVTDKTAFSGHCLCGLYEAAVPLIINSTVAAVVYVGNTVVDENQTRARTEKVCRIAGADPQEFISALEMCEHITDPDEPQRIGEIVCDYLKMLSEHSPRTSTKYHWLVEAMKRHADEAYCTTLTLKDLAADYNRNEKHMGRLWRREMGIGFHEYCLDLKLRKAEALLRNTDSKVLDIAIECGFNTISYFNRVFFKKHGMSPTQYRRM